MTIVCGKVATRADLACRACFSFFWASARSTFFAPQLFLGGSNGLLSSSRRFCCSVVGTQSTGGVFAPDPPPGPLSGTLFKKAKKR